jgi:hypothetical protein
MEKIIINVAADFTDAPGARDRGDGPYSGEQFFEEILEPKFIQAQAENRGVFINLDGTWGYASSFISGAFTRLADKFGSVTVLKLLDFQSNDDPSLPEKIATEVKKSKNYA